MLEKEFEIALIMVARSRGELNPEMQQQLDDWLSADEGNRELFDLLMDEGVVKEKLISFNKADKLVIWNKTQQGLLDMSKEVRHTKTTKLWKRVAKVAATVIAVGLGGWFLSILYQRHNHNNEDFQNYSYDISPGKQGAMLTLANGKKIRLTSDSNGPLVQEAGVSIIKGEGGQLIYEIKGSVVDVNKTNTLSTGKGETYQVRLSDGTIVYLNAGSSLTFSPALIEHGKRVVRLRGEGYFEVFSDKLHPFIVKTEKQEVEVLGTKFNVSSYEEEAEKTTLVEGSIKMLSSGVSKILKPGQQVRIRAGQVEVANVNIELATAWKDNDFIFEEESVENIMKMVARWYDVEVIYNTAKPTKTISGCVSRLDDVSKVLEIIEATGQVHFKIEGRKIYVLK